PPRTATGRRPAPSPSRLPGGSRRHRSSWCTSSSRRRRRLRRRRSRAPTGRPPASSSSFLLLFHVPEREQPERDREEQGDADPDLDQRLAPLVASPPHG